MPMTYLRKTATYTVRAPGGKELLVDEFESETRPGRSNGEAVSMAKRLLLRNGDRVSFIDDRTLQAVGSGEHLRIVHKE